MRKRRIQCLIGCRRGLEIRDDYKILTIKQIVSVMELRPNRNISESVLHDRRSINFLKNILPDDCVDCSQLQDGGTLPNIDGYLEILDEHGIAQEKIIVQVKHLTYPEENEKCFMIFPCRSMHMRNDIKANLYFL